MRLILLLLPLLLTGMLHATNSYCTDLFSNAHNFVSPALANNNGSAFSGILPLSLLIVTAVLCIMALVYGIGVAFGIQKLVTFARTEYMESIFNVCLIVVVVAGMSSLNGIADFFSSASALSLSSSPAPAPAPGTSNLQTLYTNLCSNIATNQLLPSFGILSGMTLLNEGYTALYSLNLDITPPSILPSFSFNPYYGVNPILYLIKIASDMVEGMIGLNLAIILLLFFIYFLFPLFLYLGIILRSFPWTRAAGGTFLALFISFYLVFPAIMYPFTVLPSPAANSLCTTVNATSGAAVSAANSVCPSATTNPLSIGNIGLNLLNQGSGILLTVLGQPSAGLNAIIYTYAGVAAYFVFMLAGLFISFMVCYDLLEILGRTLGAPSLNGKRLFQKIL